jgi:hypothetical protein
MRSDRGDAAIAVLPTTGEPRCTQTATRTRGGAEPPRRAADEARTVGAAEGGVAKTVVAVDHDRHSIRPSPDALLKAAQPIVADTASHAADDHHARFADAPYR